MVQIKTTNYSTFETLKQGTIKHISQENQENH